MAFSAENAALLAALQASNKELASSFDTKLSSLESRMPSKLDEGMKHMQEQIDRVNGGASAVGGSGALQLAVQHVRRAVPRSGMSSASTRGSTSASGEDYIVNPLRVMLFGLGPAKTRAQLKQIADQYCCCLGIRSVRALASPGKTFCSILVASETDAGKCFDNEITVSQDGQTYRITGKPDREPRTLAQKVGGRYSPGVCEH